MEEPSTATNTTLVASPKLAEHDKSDEEEQNLDDFLKRREQQKSSEDKIGHSASDKIKRGSLGENHEFPSSPTLLRNKDYSVETPRYKPESLLCFVEGNL